MLALDDPSIARTNNVLSSSWPSGKDYCVSWQRVDFEEGFSLTLNCLVTLVNFGTRTMNHTCRMLLSRYESKPTTPAKADSPVSPSFFTSLFSTEKANTQSPSDVQEEVDPDGENGVRIQNLDALSALERVLSDSCKYAIVEPQLGADSRNFSALSVANVLFGLMAHNPRNLALIRATQTLSKCIDALPSLHVDVQHVILQVSTFM